MISNRSIQKQSFAIDPRAWSGSRLVFLLILAGLFLAFKASLWMLVLILCHFAFFRVPGVQIHSDMNPRSPASGRVTDVDEVLETSFLNEPSVRVGIFLSVFDVHIQRSPIEGVIDYLNYQPGKFLNAMRKESSAQNESNAIGVSKGRDKILVRQISGAIARKIYWDVEIGQTITQSQKLGIICYGSRVECFLPKRCFQPKVRVGDRVEVGQTILGDWLI